MNTIQRLVKAVGVVGSLLVTASTAFACPICHTETGEKVRAGIFNDDFGSNLVLTLLPFPVLVGIVAAIHFGLLSGKIRPVQTFSDNANEVND